MLNNKEMSVVGEGMYLTNSIGKRIATGQPLDVSIIQLYWGSIMMLVKVKVSVT